MIFDPSYFVMALVGLDHSYSCSSQFRNSSFWIIFGKQSFVISFVNLSIVLHPLQNLSSSIKSSCCCFLTLLPGTTTTTSLNLKCHPTCLIAILVYQELESSPQFSQIRNSSFRIIFAKQFTVRNYGGGVWQQSQKAAAATFY